MNPKIIILICYRCYDGTVTPVEPTKNRPNIPFSENLFQEAGFISLEGETFDLRQDGVYRFYRLPRISEQRIVCRNGLLSLLKMIGYLWQYGNKDDSYSIDQLLQKSKHETLVLGCGTQAKFSQTIMSYYGVESRLVACITAEPWNGQDDGHSLLEIEDKDKKWFVYDPSFQRYFPKISIYDLCKNHALLKDSIHSPGHSGHGSFTHAKYSYSFWVEQRLLSESLLTLWYKRVLQVPLIYKDKLYHYPLSLISFTQKSKSQNWRIYKSIDDDDFQRIFYNNRKTKNGN